MLALLAAHATAEDEKRRLQLLATVRLLTEVASILDCLKRVDFLSAGRPSVRGLETLGLS